MLERGDLTALHEPFSNLADYGETDLDGRTFESPASLLTWLAGQPPEVGLFLPFIPQALSWEPGERPEWRRSARWHTDVNASSGFQHRDRRYPHTTENSDQLARFAARHRPFYEQLHSQRLIVAPREPMTGP
ncbi:hypothetical protein JQS43_17495 [Natronosporangium hydrolyticum]|uniref:Uncharacterized protein n=1 Tax=Natronosporangium hydrolyticum TaxID=2811111 RepID=A0A895YAY3_9ACTN|nr:hypothetical protein [Natronosporangium hydrolyticum]QSB13402.1 hypothetical protein JQS43_17495 [Natronosporangium hydrolyticum]